MSQISIPPLITQSRPAEWDECEDFNPVIHIRTVNFSTRHIFKQSHYLYHLTNETPIVILMNSSQTVTFPILFMTSLPALCLLTVDALLHRYKLSHNIDIVPTNDTYPKITLFNYTNEIITVQPFHLTIYCQIVLEENVPTRFHPLST